MIIDENMSIAEIIAANPDVGQILLKHGLNCLGCPGASMESLKEAADGHGTNLQKLISDLNEFFAV